MFQFAIYILGIIPHYYNILICQLETMEVEPASRIMSVLKQRFTNSTRSPEFCKTYNEPLTVFVLERQDKNLAYVTDGVHTILALSSKLRDHIYHHPLNLCKNRYYLFQEKTYLYLNFTKMAPQLQPHEMHPYHPSFYFKERYSEFINVRKTIKVSNPCELLTILKWEITLVNINASGYYAPAIIIQDFKKAHSRSPPLYMELNCILYQPQVQKNMQLYRIRDLREQLAQKAPKTFRISLFYFARHHIGVHKYEGNAIVNFDKEQNILKYTQQRPISNILASNNLEGLCAIYHFTQKNISQEESLQIQSRFLTGLLNELSISKEEKLIEQKKCGSDSHRQKEEHNHTSNQLWSDTSNSSSQAEDQIDPKRRTEMQAQKPDDNNDSSDDEDILRNLYTRMIERETK